jgi:hypothetical protein
MINQIAKYFILFLSLVLLQVLVLNNVNMGTNALDPFLYVLFIILLPFETPSWFVLFMGFVLGINVDFFSDTSGLHAASSVSMAFARPYILNVFNTRDGYESGTLPRIYDYGYLWFVRYSFILIFIHHLTFYFLESFTFVNFFRTLFISLLGTLFTLSIVIISQLFVKK